ERHASVIKRLHESVNWWCSEIATLYLGDSTLKWKACPPNTGATAARRRRRCLSTFTMRSARRISDSSVRTLTLRVGYSEPEAKCGDPTRILAALTPAFSDLTFDAY